MTNLIIIDEKQDLIPINVNELRDIVIYIFDEEHDLTNIID